MSLSAQDRIRDVRAAVATIREYDAAGRQAPMVFDAVRMRLIEIGEAVNGIPRELMDAEPTTPWRAIIGMRNWMAHQYFDTLHGYVWETVDRDLQPLLDALDWISARLGDGPPD